ncbi:hypothetical protein U1Q18_051860 [Sarracenia purpurea var. burkii]
MLPEVPISQKLDATIALEEILTAVKIYPGTGACSNCLRYVQGSTGTAIGKRKREVNSTPNSTRIVDEIMTLADINRDGRLSMNESIDYLRFNIEEAAVSEDELRDNIVAVDLNKDGFITPSEIDPHYRG